MWRFCLLALFAAGLGCVRGDEPPEQKGGFTCGLSAAYIFLNRTGHHVEYSELVREFLTQSPPDSLLAIRNVLGLHGCRTVGIKTDAEYFLHKRGPAIVCLQLSGFSRQAESHFSYLVGASRPGGAKLLDPVFAIDEPCYMTWDVFTHTYQGVALISDE